MHPLISTAELAARLDDPALRVYDCTTFLHPEPGTSRIRIETGRRLYDEQGHIPGAALIELQQDLSDASNGLRFTLPAADELARRFMAKGVGDGAEVVLYSAGDTWWATRRRGGCCARSASIARRCSTADSASGSPRAGRSSTRPHRHRPAPALPVRAREHLFTDKAGVLAALSGRVGDRAQLPAPGTARRDRRLPLRAPGTHHRQRQRRPRSPSSSPTVGSGPARRCARSSQSAAWCRVAGGRLLRRRHRRDRRRVRADRAAGPRERDRLRQFAAGVGGRRPLPMSVA